MEKISTFASYTMMKKIIQLPSINSSLSKQILDYHYWITPLCMKLTTTIMILNIHSLYSLTRVMILVRSALIPFSSSSLSLNRKKIRKIPEFAVSHAMIMKPNRNAKSNVEVTSHPFSARHCKCSEKT